MTTTVADKTADVRSAIQARQAEIAEKRTAAQARAPSLNQAPAIAHSRTTATVPDKVGHAVRTLATKADYARERYGSHMGSHASHTPTTPSQQKGWMERT